MMGMRGGGGIEIGRGKGRMVVVVVVVMMMGGRKGGDGG
jgi:hypothetical protein